LFSFLGETDKKRSEGDPGFIQIYLKIFHFIRPKLA
jgi:hypothetical protein